MYSLTPSRIALTAILLVGSAFASDPFRTDANKDEKLPWFQLKPFEFPPEGSAHHIGGELVALDHINRTATIRIDRDDTISRARWDHLLPFKMLPYGAIRYHGAPAEIRDLPIGTHLHGQFYIEEKVDKSGNGAFDRAILLEDDLSYCQRIGRVYRIDTIDLTNETLTTTGITAGKPDAKPSIFELNESAQVFKGRSIVTLKDLAPGQMIVPNLTVCTLHGPGRCVSVWIDEESRAVAAAHQIQVHHQYVHDHGLGCWVDSVDNQAGTVTVTLFDAFDPKLKEDYTDALGAAVAEETLRTYDQGTDRMKAEILKIEKIPPVPGNSGMRITFKPVTMLEGYRPKRYLRVFTGKYKVVEIPREERIYQ